jgi:hypothetical protein
VTHCACAAYLARQMPRLAYADTGDDHTPISCWLVGTKAFRPQRRLRIIPRQSKNIHKAHTIIFYPGLGRPSANSPTSCFGELSRIHKMLNSQVQVGRFDQLLLLPVFLFLFLPSLPLNLGF